MAFKFVLVLSAVALASGVILPGDSRYGHHGEHHGVHHTGHGEVTYHGNQGHNAGHGGHHIVAAAPVYSHGGYGGGYGHGYGHGHHDEYHNAPAHYEFNYGVADHHTGDIKDQHEKREGDSVVGHYSLVEPDGHRRIVHYSADAHSGFQAVVQREGHGHGHQGAQQHYAGNRGGYATGYGHAGHTLASYSHAAPVHHAVAVHAAPVHHVAVAAPAYHHGGYAQASHGLSGHGHGHASSYQSINLHHDNHHGHHY